MLNSAILLKCPRVIVSFLFYPCPSVCINSARNVSKKSILWVSNDLLAHSSHYLAGRLSFVSLFFFFFFTFCLTNVKPPGFSIHILLKMFVSVCMWVRVSLKYSQNPLEYAVRVSGRILCHFPFYLKNSILKKIFFIHDIFLTIHFDRTTCFGKYIFSTNHSNELIHFHYVSFLAKYLQNLLS